MVKEVKSKVEVPKNSKVMNYYLLENDAKNLSGKILTLIDASIADKQQNKALKDLIKQRFRDYIFDLQRQFFEKGHGHSVDL